MKLSKVQPQINNYSSNTYKLSFKISSSCKFFRLWIRIKWVWTWNHRI